MRSDFAMLNGRIYTLDGKIAEAVAAYDGIIIGVGTSEEIRLLIDSQTEIIDLKGHTVLPGFNDSHLHLLAYGASLDEVDLHGVQSIQDLIHRSRKFIEVRGKRPGEWVVGAGWDQNCFFDKRFPDKGDLDQISLDHPIFFERSCGHVAVMNSAAINHLHLSPDIQVRGGIFDRDEKGELTGFIQQTAIEWVVSRRPKPDKNQMMGIISAAAGEMVKVGLTSVQTDDLDEIGFTIFDDLVDAYRQLRIDGKLPLRIYEEVQTPEKVVLEKFLTRGLRTGDGDDFFRIGPIKLILDGSLGSRTAALREEYCDEPGNTGILTYSQAVFDDLVATAHQEKMQVAVHAIGDAALETALNGFEKALQIDPSPRRHRIVHCQIGDQGLYKRMGRLGMLADIQPSFVITDWKAAERSLGLKRTQVSYAWKTLLNCGVVICGGSDSPIESFNPLEGIYAAVTRKTAMDYSAPRWLPWESLTVEEAVRLYTICPAFASFEEDSKGTITIGKLADMVVLSQDPFTVVPEDIAYIKNLATIVGGKVQYLNGL